MAEGDAQEVHCILVLGSTPELANQLMARPNPASMVDQHLQKVILGRSQIDRGLANKYFSPDQIDSEIIHHKNIVRCWVHAAQACAHARQQLWDGKRLGEIVVSASIKGADFLRFFVAYFTSPMGFANFASS